MRYDALQSDEDYLQRTIRLLNADPFYYGKVCICRKPDVNHLAINTEWYDRSVPPPTCGNCGLLSRHQLLVCKPCGDTYYCWFRHPNWVGCWDCSEASTKPWSGFAGMTKQPPVPEIVRPHIAVDVDDVLAELEALFGA